MPKVTRNGGGLLLAPGLVLYYIGNQFPCTAYHLTWRWQQHQVPPTHQYLRANLHGVTS